MTTLGATPSTTEFPAGGGATSSTGMYKAGWYVSSGRASFANPVVATVNRLIATQIIIPKACTVDRIGINCDTVAASSTVRLGIYSENSDGFPGTLVLDAGTVNTASGTGDKEITISQALSAGVHWLAAVAQGGTPTLSTWTTGSTGTGPASTFQTFAYYFGFHTASDISGALPTPFVTTWTDQPIRVWLRYA